MTKEPEDWAARIEELESEIRDLVYLSNGLIKTKLGLEEQNRKLREIIDSHYETCALVKPAYALTGHLMKPERIKFHMELLDEDFKKVLDDNRESLYEKE
jgi:hypothetical protein